MVFETLTAFEREAIATILRHDHPVMNALRVQLAACGVADREFTGAGFYTQLVVPDDAAPAEVTPGRLHLGGAWATLDGLEDGAGFLLYVEHGRLDVLECFVYGVVSWPERLEHFAVFPVVPLSGDDSDLAQVQDAWDPKSAGDRLG